MLLIFAPIEKQRSGQAKREQSTLRTSNSQIPIRSQYREAGDQRTTDRRPSVDRQCQLQSSSTVSSSDSKSSQTTETFTESTSTISARHWDRQRSRGLVFEEIGESKQTLRRRRKKNDSRGQTIDLPDSHIDHLEGLDVIRSKLESMTDDQWNRVLDILNGQPTVEAPIGNEISSSDLRNLSPRPRRPRVVNNAGPQEKSARTQCTQKAHCRARRLQNQT